MHTNHALASSFCFDRYPEEKSRQAWQKCIAGVRQAKKQGEK
jgi:hypothetical protein